MLKKKNYKFIESIFSKTIKNARKPIAKIILFFFSFLESIIIPIPVDPLLGLLVLAQKNKFFLFFVLCTFGSVLGAIVGWFIGFFIGPEIKPILSKLPWIDSKMFHLAELSHKNHGYLIVFLGAFTPLPFKVIAITSGVFKVNLIIFIFMSVLGRGLRFFIISFLVNLYGERGIMFLKKNFFSVTVTSGLVILALYFLF